MDVDKLQRINNLARELMKHGMAGSMDEAVRMAEEKIQGNPEVSNIRNTMANDVISQSQVVPSSSGSSTPKMTEDLEVRKLRISLEDQSKMVNAMAGKIDELVTEFNRLQQEINRLKTIQVPPAGDKEGQTQFRQPAEEKKSGAHARSGNYKPEDVAIEKMFYYGNK
ncbi:MAG: hypothetical protein KJ574_00275 [Nanoarchaeota archaeon]|nr:hypothetical protein [Nanoarchaeota archaeon]